MKALIWSCLASCIVLSLFITPLAFGIAGTDRVAIKGQPVTVIAGWPEGVGKVLNDPVRAAGWHHWFSECPNDNYAYEMDISNMADVNRLIGNMATIQSEGIEVSLDPTKASTHGNKMGAVFTLGNQMILNLWFFNLKFDKSGVRRFGLHRLVDPPVAQPPTLFLYVGHPAIDLKQLVIPAGVKVTSYVSLPYKQEHPNEPTILAIEPMWRTTNQHHVDKITGLIFRINGELRLQNQ